MRNEQNDLAEENSSWIIKNLLDVLVCSVADRVFLLVLILTHPTGSSKYGTTRKNTQRYYKPKRLIRYIYDPSALTKV